MPTPSSSNPPPDPPHSGASHSFPSCPEDAHHRSHNARSRANITPSQHQVQTIAANVEAATSPVGSIESYDSSLAPVPTEHVSAAAMESQTDGPISTAPSSRATTSSTAPDRPATAATTVASPTASFRSDHDEDAGSGCAGVGDDGKKNNANKAAETWLVTCDSPSSRGPADDGGREAVVQTSIIPTKDGWVVADTDRDDEITCCMHSGFPSSRMLAWSSSSLLRPGSRFQGTQQSERQIYDVRVEIQHVDLRESYLCGYLEIHGLTDEHPTLTTFFEGEIIGTKYSFMTDHPTWGSCDKIDLSHWLKFNAFRRLAKHAKRADDGAVRALRRLVIPDITQQENIFMRWKEQFLVPDHRVRTIANASFEGFYYICFNQLEGEVNGIYFHHKSEKFQQLDLRHVPDRGRFHAMEFR